MITGEKTRALREWAFFSSLMVVAGLIGIVLPPFYFLVKILFPLPVILLSLRLDSRYSFLGLTAAAVLLLLFVPGYAAVLILILQYGLLGILYGILFKNFVPSDRSIAAGILGAALLVLLSSVLLYALTGENPLVLSQEGRQAAEQWLALNQSAGAFNNLPPEVQERLVENVLQMFDLFMPGQIIVASAAEAVITYLLARVLLSRLKFSLPPGLAFTGISFPWYTVWGLILGLGLTLAGDQFSIQAAAKVGKNILFVLSHAYIVLGLSVAAYYYQKIKLSVPLKVLIVVMAFIYFPFSIFIILLLGVTDSLINFRRLTAPKS